ncbi:MAG: ABC transporter permease [Methanosarcina sp.]|uniref:ABC transporter permease n=1 Tax=Methanosarcina sp. TaxID=2213 RepID=UPI0026326D20|nr:ABC transporter permease [Methanosarcina sp.]MDD3246571.1 ABC transporter permease [Methanosarcina sp.]
MIVKHLKELYGYRNLIWQLAWSEFKLRYKNSILGYFWSLLEPLLMLLVLYVVFSNLMRVQVEYYQLFLLLGIILWGFFSRATTIGMFSIVGKPSMVKKIYFPRDIFVISSCITALLMSIFESLIFIMFMVFFRVPISINLVYVPLILSFLFIISLGFSLILSALNVFYRDVQFIWQVLLQIGYFGTPILYTIDIFPKYLQKFVLLNPIARILISARDTIIYSSPAKIEDLLFMFLSSIFFLLVGYIIFSRLEPRFAEEI